MLGWMMIFGLMFFAAFSTLATTLATNFSAKLADQPLSLIVATGLSGFLLLACILTRVVRGRA